MCQTKKLNDQTRQLRNALGRFPTGVAVVTARSQIGNPIGITVNSFSSISLDPILVAWCIDCRSSSYSDFSQCASFNINILADHQQHVAKQFPHHNATSLMASTIQRTSIPF